MKRRKQLGQQYPDHPDAFDLAWLDDEEIHKLQEAMQSNRENHICGYWLHCLNEQLAIRAGKLHIMPRCRGQTPRFKAISVSHLHAAGLTSALSESTSELLLNQPANACVKCSFNVAKARCDDGFLN
jgi:hypothetical protein